MKKVSLLMAAFALVLGFSQCSKKPVMPTYSGPAGDRIIQNVTLNATQSNGGGDSKIVEDGIGKVKWKKDDIIIVKQNDEEVGELKCTNPANDKFTGSIIASKEYDLIFEFCTENFREKFLNQTGALNDAIKLSGKTQFEEDGSYEVKMKMSGAAVLKLDLSYFAPSPSKANEVTVEIRVKAEGKDGSDPIASVKCAPDRLGEVYVAVPANEKPATYTFRNGSGKTVDMPWKALEENTFYTKEGSTTGEAIVIEPAAPTTPTFTVADGKTVEFSPGNLQYLGKAEEGHKWRFAEHQWDHMGAGPSATSNSGNVDLGADYEGKYNTGSGSEAARDLFGWGCTGFQDIRTSSTGYQTNYQPYSTSTSTVNTTYNYYGYGPDYVSSPYYNLTVADKSDWGCNAIYTHCGDATGSGWRTLTSAEWKYLLDTRTTVATGIPASSRYALVKVDGKCGMMIFPDEFAWPSSVTKTPTTFNTYSSDWNGVNYGVGAGSDFEALEGAGVVFLPAAGYRFGTSLYIVGSYGNYWSSSCSSRDGAECMFFMDGVVDSQGRAARRDGHSVRLVR